MMWLQKQDPDRVSAVKEAMELQVEACMKEEEEAKVAAASSSDTSVDENPEDDWFGTITQAPSARGKDILKARRHPWPMRPLRCPSL
jgi:hypothetical protein